MAQQTDPSNNPLLDYMLGSQGKNTAKTVNDILQGTGLQNTYNTQVALGNAATQDQQKLIGSYANDPNVMIGPMQDVANQNMIKDSSMPVNLLLGILSQASQLQQNGNNNAASIYNNQQNNLTTQRGQNGQYTGSLAFPTGSSNPMIDTFVKGIMAGQSGLNDVPEAMRGPVISALQQKGYDPAKEVFGDVGQLQSLWDDHVSEANPVARGKGKLEDLLSAIGMETPGEKAKQQYVAKAKEFAGKYGGILGKNVDLPSVTDSNEVALNKLDNLVSTLHNKFYQGNTSATAQ